MAQDYQYFWENPPDSAPRLLTASWHSHQFSRDFSCKHLHDHWVLDYTIDPAGMGRAGSTAAPWKPRAPHTAHLYPPQTPYWEKMDAPVSGAFIIFDGGETAGLTRLIRAPFGYAKLYDHDSRLEEPFLQTARAGAECGDDGYWDALGACCRLFSLLLQAEWVEEETWYLPGEETAQPTELLRAVRTYFRQHMADPVRLDDLAAHLHMSPSSLSHRYREEADEPPMRTLQAMRIEMAKTLLLRGERLESIARETGFHDAFHLSRTFKRLTGLSPSDFRTQLRRQ